MNERWNPPIVTKTDEHEQRREYLFCVYCGNDLPADENWKRRDILQCERCFGIIRIGTRADSSCFAPHIIPVLCPHADCGCLTWVNRLERLGETKTSCRECRQPIVIKTDNFGKLQAIATASLVDKKKRPAPSNTIVALAVIFVFFVLMLVFIGRSSGGHVSSNGPLSVDPNEPRGRVQRGARAVEFSPESGSGEVLDDSRGAARPESLGTEDKRADERAPVTRTPQN